MVDALDGWVRGGRTEGGAWAEFLGTDHALFLHEGANYEYVFNL
jgi:hypothetical protein